MTSDPAVWILRDGKHLIELDGGAAEFACHHAAMRVTAITRQFGGRIESGTYRPSDDRVRALRRLEPQP